MPVGEMLSRMSSAEYAHWIALDTNEFIGDLRGDYQAANIASTIVNMWRGKGQQPLSLLEFMHFVPKPSRKKRQTENLRAHLTLMAGKRKKRGNSRT